MAFIDLEKAFDRVIWWVLRESGVEERFISVIKIMYVRAMTAVTIGACESKKFPVKLVYTKVQS